MNESEGVEYYPQLNEMESIGNGDALGKTEHEDNGLILSEQTLEKSFHNHGLVVLIQEVALPFSLMHGFEMLGMVRVLLTNYAFET